MINAGWYKASSPGARVAEVCRRHDISSALIYTWRRKLREAGAAQAHNLPDEVPAPAFAEAVMEEAALPATLGQHPAIIVDLVRGRRLSIFAAASSAQVAAALKALR